MDSGMQISCHNRLGMVKNLGSWDKNIRDKVVALLKLWLTAQKEVGEEDMEQVLKGLFCCVWNPEKQLIRPSLIEKPFSIIGSSDLKLARQLAVIRREWSGIDYLGTDKFNLLLRQILQFMFLVLDSNGWNSEAVDMGDMTCGAFLPIDKHSSWGINLHFINVYLNQLHGFCPVRLEIFVLLIESFYSVFAKAFDSCLLNRVKGDVFDCLLGNCRNLLKSKQDGHDIDEKVKNLGSIALTMRMTKSLFGLAAFSSTLHANRKVQCELHKEFSRLNKILTASWPLISPCGAWKPKIYDSESAEQSLELETVTIQELPLDCGSEAEAQQVDNIEGMEQASEHVDNDSGKRTRSGKAKKIVNDIYGSSTRKSKAKGPSDPAGSSTKKAKVKSSFYIHENLSQFREVQDAAVEESSNRVCSHQDCMNPMKEADSLDLVGTCFGDSVKLDVSVIPDLQQQFEKAAAKLDEFSSQIPSVVVAVSPLNTRSKKRKRVESTENGFTTSSSPSNSQEKGESITGSDHCSGVESAGKNVQKRVKKVRFSLKNNLVWKPHSPLPPESLRVPPSATPRGSALKKGVPPGPIYTIQKPPTKKLGLRQRSTSTRKSPKNPKNMSSPKVLRKQRSVVR